MPSAPGKLPNRLSNEWFSIMISMTWVIGTSGLAGAATAAGAMAGAGAAVNARAPEGMARESPAEEPPAAVAANTHKQPAASCLECLTRPIVPRAPLSVLFRARCFPLYFAVIAHLTAAIGRACGPAAAVPILQTWATEMCWAASSSHVEPIL